MQFTNEILMKAFIVVLAVGGFFIARYIRRHKTQNTPLVCPVRFDCHTVVHSDYARFLGIPVEILGMLYYALTAIVYLIFILSPYTISYNYISLYNIPFLSQYGFYINISIMFCLSLVAFLFSAYLIVVQIFILKKGCSWCIVSAFVCLVIFIITSFLYHFGFVTQLFLG